MGKATGEVDKGMEGVEGAAGAGDEGREDGGGKIQQNEMGIKPYMETNSFASLFFKLINFQSYN